jgi:hypothetical protein
MNIADDISFITAHGRIGTLRNVCLESGRLPEATLTFPVVSRRKVLLAALVNAFAGVFMPGASSQAIAAPAESEGEQFLRISRLLTGKSDLDPAIAARTLEAMTARDAQFSTRFGALAKALDTAGLHDITDFERTAIAADPALKQTTVEIVSAWYLGVVGEGETAKLVTYENALMFRPTRDVTAPPATGGGEFGSWSAKPQ